MCCVWQEFIGSNVGFGCMADFREEFCVRNVRLGVVVRFLENILHTCQVHSTWLTLSTQIYMWRTEPNPHFMPIHLLCLRAILRCHFNRLDLFPPHPLSPPPPLLPLLTLPRSYLSCLHWFMTWNNLTSVIWYVCYTVHHQYIWLCHTVQCQVIRVHVLVL